MVTQVIKWKSNSGKLYDTKFEAEIEGVEQEYYDFISYIIGGKEVAKVVIDEIHRAYQFRDILRRMLSHYDRKTNSSL